MVIWQPPLSVFDSTSPYFTGDIGIILTPNSNWRTSAIESAVGDYNSDVQHGVDYAFGVKSLRFYRANSYYWRHPASSYDDHEGFYSNE